MWGIRLANIAAVGACCVFGFAAQFSAFAAERQWTGGGEPVELPDFTRGAWRTAKPQDIGTVDFKSLAGTDPIKA